MNRIMGVVGFIGFFGFVLMGEASGHDLGADTWPVPVLVAFALYAFASGYALAAMVLDDLA